MKRVLIIAYYYPPLGGGGILRTLKFIKYLPQYGYEPVVIAPENGTWIAYDHELEKTVKHIRTIRVPVPGLEAIDSSFGKTVPERVKKYYLKFQNQFHPDPRWRWITNISPNLSRWIDQEEIDVIFTTSPPHSVHGVAVEYKKNGGQVPWVADFRDSFYSDPNLGKDIKSKVKKLVYGRYQTEYVRWADVVVCATEPIARKMIRVHGQAEKFRVITNGFDPEDLEDIEPSELPSDKFILTYTGSFIGARTPEHLIYACVKVLEHHPSWKNLLRLRFVGSFSQRDKELFAKLPPEMVEVQEFLTHRDALKLQVNSSANCLIISVPKERGGDEIFTGKIFEYIYAERPILALVPDGVAKDLIEKYNLGYVADAQNIEAVSGALGKMLNDHICGAKVFRDFAQARKLFDRKFLAGELAKVFDEVINIYAKI